MRLHHPPIGATAKLAVALIATTFLGCGDDESAADPVDSSVPMSDGALAEGCTPDQALFESDIKPLLDSRCGLCHGETTEHGAPYAVLDYDALLENDAMDRRKVDRVLARVADGTMPPAGNVRPTETEFASIANWASCGGETPPYPSSLTATRDRFDAPTELPADTTVIELLANGFEAVTDVDHYQNFRFKNIVDKDVFVKRFGFSIDQSTIVHHITLHYDNEDSDEYLYAWAPGTRDFEFPEGGLRIKPTDGFRVEIHYNNPHGRSGLKDNSGILLYVTEPEGTEYAMLDLNTFAINLPANSQTTVATTCEADNDFHILAGLPHMHELGTSYEHTVTRADGSSESLIELDGWAFDQQYFYHIEKDIAAEDTMTIKCTYKNDSSSAVRGGPDTGDEMCFDFVYVTPPTASASCAGGL